MVKLSHSGRALEIVLDNLPSTVFTLRLFVPKEAVRAVIDEKKVEVDVSLLMPNMRNESCEKKPS